MFDIKIVIYLLKLNITKMGRTKKENKTVLKPVPVYLTEEKHAALAAISDKYRIPMTKLLEDGVDDLIKKEAKNV